MEHRTFLADRGLRMETLAAELVYAFGHRVLLDGRDCTMIVVAGSRAPASTSPDLELTPPVLPGAQIEADLAKRRFILVDPANRLVADTLEGEWNQKLRALALSREELARAKEQNQRFMDEAVESRLMAMTSDFT